ncbi:MAG: lipid A-modifier LpxR family protein [Opitutales bacterium]
MKTIGWLGFLLGSLSLLCPALPGHQPAISAYWENDILVGTDREYTNGVRLSLRLPADSALGRTPALRTVRDWMPALPWQAREAATSSLTATPLRMGHG